MIGLRTFAVAAGLTASFAAPASAYPGGTPDYQTDVAPFCAGCHSSRSELALAGAGERAAKETAERKHLALIETGAASTDYALLSQADRQTLAAHVRAVDAASTVSLVAPARVHPGQTFPVTVKLTGGAGPAVGVALVDADHRWLARPAPSAGWAVVEPPLVIGPDGQPQSAWLEKRPAEAGRGLAYVNVTGLESDAAAGRWPSAEVTFTLRAPDRPGRLPLAAVFFYGTEKASPLGSVADALGRKHPRGGFTGSSGRLLFTPVRQIEVAP
jgi:hypothetical protein